MNKDLKGILQCLLDNKASDVVYFDVEKRNPYVKYFILATANSYPHAYALANHLRQNSAKENLDFHGIEGKKGSEWILVDMYDYVVHIFTNEGRKKYAFEKLYGELELRKVEE